jgi:hypothetical protein
MPTPVVPVGISFCASGFQLGSAAFKLPVTEPLRPCLSYHIGRCDAPCALLTTEEDYRKLVDEAVLLLKGKRNELRKTLEADMRAAAAAQLLARAKPAAAKPAAAPAPAKPAAKPAVAPVIKPRT